MALKRTAVLALALGAITCAGPLSAQPASPLLAAGWAFVAYSEGTAVFMKHADDKGPSGGKQAWTAYELETARDREGFAFRSVKSLSEYNCEQRQARVVAETFHAEPALKGKDFSAADSAPTEWAAPAPGSVGDLRMDFACRPAA